MSVLIPNTYQAPNAYIDRYLHLFTSEEWKILSYMTRLILGYDDKRLTQTDHISLSQFMSGAVTKKGARRDYGTGLSKNTIMKSLKSLQRFGFVEALGEHPEKGQCWKLQLDDSKIDVQALEQRDADLQAKNQRRVQKASRAAMEKRGSDRGTNQGIGSWDEPMVVHQTNRWWFVARTHINPCQTHLK